MGQVMFIRRRRQAAGAGFPAYTYTGDSRFVADGEHNWSIRFLTGGVFTPQNAVTIDAFLVGGGGAGSQKGGAGGGGYNATKTGIPLLAGFAYPISVGAGGITSDAAGGSSSAFGQTSNGGTGGISGTATGQKCVVIGTTGSAGNVYSYKSLSASAVSIGSGQHTVSLAYPHTAAYHNNGTYLRKGVSGYYRCNIVSKGAYITKAGGDGTGGNAAYAFGGSSGALYGGPGGAPGTAGGGANTGKGGDGSGSYSGTAFGVGGSGIVIARNTR